jgi:hypothetical protein
MEDDEWETGAEKGHHPSGRDDPADGSVFLSDSRYVPRDSGSGFHRGGYLCNLYGGNDTSGNFRLARRPTITALHRGPSGPEAGADQPRDGTDLVHAGPLPRCGRTGRIGSHRYALWRVPGSGRAFTSYHAPRRTGDLSSIACTCSSDIARDPPARDDSRFPESVFSRFRRSKNPDGCNRPFGPDR